MPSQYYQVVMSWFNVSFCSAMRPFLVGLLKTSSKNGLVIIKCCSWQENKLESGKSEQFYAADVGMSNYLYIA